MANKGYTKVYHSWFELGLSMDALGIFLYMSSKRKDWVFRSAEIRKTLGIGSHKWRSATNELKQIGLYITTKTSNGTTITVGKLEESTTGRKPTSAKPTSGKPTSGKPTPLIRLNINKTDSNKTDSNKTDSNITSFDDFWSVYPKKNERKKCAAIWKRRALDDIGAMIVADVESRLLNDGKWIKDDGTYVPYPQTYLNGDLWEDEIQPQKPHQAQGKYKLNRDFLDTGQDESVIEGVVIDRSIGGTP
jgi:hypothetical protein